MKIRSRWLSFCVAWALVAGFRLLLATCRKVYIAPEPRQQLDKAGTTDHPDRFVLCVWHDALIIPTFGASAALRRRTCCLVSRHQDGSYLADIMYFLGYTTVRGSSNKGGAAALKQLLEDTAGKHIVITPDGPRGPRREMKPGPVYLASQTARPLCAGAYVCQRGWRIQGSWTDMLIPRPFTKVYLLTGTPIPIPPDLSREQLHHYIDMAQAEMDRLDAAANAILSGQPVPEAPWESPSWQQAA